MMIDRSCVGLLKEMLSAFPVVAVVGPRQVGKSTLVQLPQVGNTREYHTLDDFSVLDMAQKDPVGLVESDGPVTLDEVQRCPDVLLAVKRAVDKRRSAGRFLLTGSADLSYCADLARTLAGRVGVLRLRPLSWREQTGSVKRPSLISWIFATSVRKLERELGQTRMPEFDSNVIFRGGYPLAVTAKSRKARELWFESFRYTYLERDIRQISEIGNLSDFARLFELSATRTAQVLNQASLARDAGLSTATTGRYFSLMEATFQIERLRPWFANIGKRLVKSPKLYWTDTGVASYLLGLRNCKEAVSAGFIGPLLETFVVMEIENMLATYLPSSRLYYLRTHGGMEVDGIITSGRRILPFEVKASSTLRGEDARSLQAFIDAETRACMGLVFYLGRDVRRLSSNVLALPVAGVLA